jgi:phage terminase large subunit-like protein
MVQFGLRLGPHPRMVLTTTPKRRPKLKQVIARHDGRDEGRTSDNLWPARAAARGLYQRYGGTSLGRQELDAEIIEDTVGALWKRGLIEMGRAVGLPILERVVVAIDPSATSSESSDEAGIIVVGVANGHGYVLDDVSLRGTPAAWARAAVMAYHKYAANMVIAETNNGGEMVEFVVHSVDPTVPYQSVTASRGKQTRAEPISALYEQAKVHHVGMFPLLEDQMCSWLPGEKSPDRMDALVWGLTYLMASDNPWAGLGSAGGIA